MSEQLTSEQKLTAGTQLYYVPQGRRGTPIFVTVTKVGRIYATLDNGERINIQTLWQDDGQYSSRAKCWRSKEEYESSLALEKAWREFCQLVDRNWQLPDGVTINQIQNARRALFKETA